MVDEVLVRMYDLDSFVAGGRKFRMKQEKSQGDALQTSLKVFWLGSRV